ncbi:hypothetical protein A4H97_24295 [Niastella yeongjuensis]|uniref:Uncharacterized protein n=1 Tax=Niastella yeongjuensis TaxID=354355 RepID=A0A1V9F338_9BACT|nr:hypothetical protein [Niastella yeongjuensis]OQP52823.1 hypothetical protein A4H97_24295 [Niastella yeongjuensis]SEP20559.1 hypothetical protein SAMN05660816_04747 [Niastella yeongjuensis]
MEIPFPCYRYLLPCINLIVAFLLCGFAANAQLPVDTSAKGVRKFKQEIHTSIKTDSTFFRKDPLRISIPHLSKDTISPIAINIKTNFQAGVNAQKKRVLAGINEQRKSLLTSLKLPKTDSITIDVNNHFKKLFDTRPILKINSGMVCYNANYRSFIDTPYLENGILQNNLTGRLNLTVAGVFPLQLNFWLRQSNSHFFKNIYDVQIAFNGAAFQEKLRTGIRERLLALAPAIKDPRLEKLYMDKLSALIDQENVLKTIFNPQKLVEANEIIKVPKLTWDGNLPDSVNVRREDSSKKAARFFLSGYDSTKKVFEQVRNQVDSLKNKYEDVRQRVRQYQQLVNGNWNDLQSERDWKNKLQEYGLSDIKLPAKYRWLLGLRSFSLGRSPVNYSELTAKNVSINGISVEYNSWYYLALTAGMVNYRFRDFVVNNVNRKPQYLGMVRAGLGRLEKNYFILSAYRGRKQLFASSATVNSTITITGLSAASRWAINRTSYLTAEVGKSVTPDFRNNPPNAGGSNVLKLSDKDNQAIAFHLYSVIPITNTKIEAAYKKTGANYQSFSSYSTNAAMESWYIKADQSLLKRKLRIAASLRKNEFVNPFIVQDYKGSTLFKSLTGTLRIRKWPLIIIGYQPMSQYTKVDDLVMENRFQTFNATLFHNYTVHQLRMATTIMVNKFYNHNTDTGFVYYNATNSYFTQHFYFNAFTANAGISVTKNSRYTLQVLDGGIQPNIPRFGTIGIGIRINNWNNSEIKAGGYMSANIRLWKQDMVFLNYEHGYLPGNKNQLVRNEMGTVQFIKTFNFK